MQIPKEAVEKAIEGGWRPRGMKANKKFEFEIDHHVVFNDTINVFRMSFEAIALDPSFGEALEVATRIPCGVHTKRGYCVNCDGKGYHTPNGTGLLISEKLCHLILTKADTAAFWKEILGTTERHLNAKDEDVY